MRVFDHPGSLLGLLLLLVAPGEQAAGSPRVKVDCVCHNADYVICDWGSRQKPLHNYSFYFWYEGLSSGSTQCEDYIQRDGLNVACRLSDPQFFNYFRMFLNGSRGPNIVPEAVSLNDRVRPGKPFNLTVSNESNHQLLLAWETPYRKPGCLEHSVRYKSSRDTQWTFVVVRSLKFQMASMDPKKRYTFYVKSKMNKVCATTDLWSEESDSASWGEDAGPSSPRNMVILLGSFFLLLMVVLFLVRMERVRVVLMPRIPNPSRKFEDLFTAYKGNFSEWAGVSKDALEAFKPSYYENICPIMELLPGGGYLPASSEATVKTGGPPDPLPDPAPKASPDLVARAT